MERDNLMELHDMLHQENVAAAQYTAGNSVFEYYWEHARKQYVQYYNLRLPYDKQDIATDVQSLTDLWFNTWGKLDDPDVQRKIKMTEDFLNDMIRRKRPGENNA